MTAQTSISALNCDAFTNGFSPCRETAIYRVLATNPPGNGRESQRALYACHSHIINAVQSVVYVNSSVEIVKLSGS